MFKYGNTILIFVIILILAGLFIFIFAPGLFK